MAKASTRNLKSDHIFACILHLKNHLSCKYNDFRSHLLIVLFDYHYCSVTTAARSVKFPCICFFSHSYHCQPRIPTKTPELGGVMRGRNRRCFSRAVQAQEKPERCSRHREGCPCPRDAQGLGTTSWCAGEQPELGSPIPSRSCFSLLSPLLTPISFSIPSLKLWGQ